MAIERMYFDVLLDDPETPDATVEHRVEVRATDQLRAELEGKKLRGIGLSDAMHTTYLWCWAALVREGKFAGNFSTFVEQCIQAGGDKKANKPVDPTQLAASTDSA